MKVIDALKSKKYEWEKFDMSDAFIAEFIGFENIADDQIEDLQTHINNLHWEGEALLREVEAEFC